MIRKIGRRRLTRAAISNPLTRTATAAFNNKQRTRLARARGFTIADLGERKNR